MDRHFIEEIRKRRTFGIISHPDAGKTTIVPGTYLSVADPDGVKQWRVSNGLD